MNTIYDIILADGTRISAYLNGNNYITDDYVDAEMLADDNLVHIVIGGEDFYNMHCTNLWEDHGQKRFIIRELTSQELARLELNAKIEYLALMSGIDIDF